MNTSPEVNQDEIALDFGVYRALLRDARDYHFADVLTAAHLMLNTAESLTATLTAERERTRLLVSALDAHLCPNDKADWIACGPTDVHRRAAADSGLPFCEVCDDAPPHSHRLARLRALATTTADPMALESALRNFFNKEKDNG